jgi:hypothetical protein
VYEHLEDEKSNILSVIPVTHDSFYKFVKNPFKRPDKNKAFRLNVQATTEDNSVIDNALEIITCKNISLED